MILRSLKKWKPLPSVIPNHEGGKNGDGTLCQIGISQTLYLGAKYVPFVPNGINWVAQGNSDVISSRFTGCIMAAFTHEGIRKVCHISTGAGQDCKEEWEKIKSSSFRISEFKPSNYISTGGHAFVNCLGLITLNNRAYAITVVNKDGQNIVSKIKSVHL